MHCLHSFLILLIAFDYMSKSTLVMLIRNIDTENGHCNGTRYLVRRMYKSNIIEAVILTGK